MKQPHIQLDESLNVRYAILPGDPRRAERIASHMSEVEDLGMNREYRSLVGAYRGARILAMSTGMGGVSTGIAVEELHNIGVTHAIRIGSCGTPYRQTSLPVSCSSPPARCATTAPLAPMCARAIPPCRTRSCCSR
ncbi:MAG: hypothetical protein ACLUEU_12050 [Oscillospiraceae bacterium]